MKENQGKNATAEALSNSPESTLRRQAEEMAAAEEAALPDGAQAISPEVARQTLHGLRVHQIELEMQNEELRRAQLELDAARARYFDLYDLAPVGYCTLSEQGLILEANIRCAALLGLARNELVKRPISRFILNEDQDRYYLHRRRLLESGQAQSCELRMLKNDGSQFWAQLAATDDKDADGARLHRLVLSDITDRKLMEAAMQASEQRFRTLIEWTPEAINVHRGGKFIYLNPAATRMLGARSAHDLIGKPILTIIHPDFHQAVQEDLQNVADHGINVELNEMKFLKLDGTPIEVEAQATSIVYEGAPAVHVAWRDITERKRLRQALQEKGAELEHSTQVAEKANLAKSDFLSSMSHELRSPLNAILGFAQLLESGSPSLTPTQKARIDQILQAGWYLLELINEILDLALIESGKLSLSLEPMSLSGVLLDCQAMIEPQAQKSGIRVNFPQFDHPVFVRTDRTRLKQVLINLLSNAIKYNHSGGTVDVTCSLDTVQRIRVRVQDSGDGLSPEQLAHLFQPFNRLGQETNTKEGTGIGLVVTKRLVELMGGTIGVSSATGVGSVFWFELSLTDPPQLAALPAGHAALVRPPVDQDTPLRTLLYVEDNPANLELVEQLVARRSDLGLLSAADGQGGIDLARRYQPEVILMDINLPGISGVDAMKLLRADPSTAHIPIIALSANAVPSDIEKGLAAGFFRYLTKPFKVDEFMDTLNLALKFAETGSTRVAGRE